MEIKALLKLKEHENNKYELVGNNIYRNLNNNKYCAVLYCELKNNEFEENAISEISNKYNLTCSVCMSKCNINGKSIFSLEVEGNKEDLEKMLLTFRKEHD